MQMRLLRRPQRSLRTILVVWFLVFSIAPLTFVTGYSVIKYEKAIDHELAQRLSGNGREIGVIFGDFKKGLEERRDGYIQNPILLYGLSINDVKSIKGLASDWVRSEIATSLTFFNRTGRMLLSLFRASSGGMREFVPAAGSAIYLADENLKKLSQVKDHAFIEFSGSKKMSLILFSRVTNRMGKIVGYLEQVIDLDESFLANLRERMKLELILMRRNGQVAVSTHSDFYDYSKSLFQDHVRPDSTSYFELSVRGDSHGFLMYPLKWGSTDFFLALGASKVEAKAVLRNVNYAFYSVVGAVIFLLVVIILVASNAVLRPLDDLVRATQSLQDSDQPVEIPIKSDTEIGLLTESFNQMSRNIQKARGELKAKIKELEDANRELKETQARLVHSSKMISLGQLVAGVAHELNNPIGFIYSNMAHLRDYSDRLLQVAEAAEKNPMDVSRLRKELELDYLREDLPKLIASCEDGAKRVRDIVLGLRNFSRLEEAKPNQINLHEAIDNTLSLLSGEIKNRIQVHRNYGEIPLVTCYASQINQVLMNILSNAVQAIEGNGSVWITTKKILSQEGQEMVSISFQDSGKGMGPEVIDKIFDPFFTTKAVGQGTGLGLSISYGIIQNHGGDIQVKSQPGTGTEFLVTVPVKPDGKMERNAV